jgi:ligand-binding sensor domain-containing protein/AraC-like DNA-binding protein
MLQKIRMISIVLLWLLSTAIVVAQDESPLQTAVSFSSLSIDNGLSSNTVRALLQDRKGFVWIGTSRGLNRYDGHQVTALPATRAMSVTSMVEWGDTLWVGTENGLFLYQQRTDHIEKYKFPMQKNAEGDLNVSDLKVDASGRLWMATMGQGILVLDIPKGTLRAVSTPDGGKSYGCIYVSTTGTVWASSNWVNHNLVRYDSRKDQFLPVELQASATGRMPERVAGITLCEDAERQMWLGAWDGSLIRFDNAGHQAEVVFTAEETGMQHVHSILEVKPGTLLVGSDKGLDAIDVKKHKVRMHNRGDKSGALSDNFIYPLLKDREGGTWIGTYYGGVNYTHPISGNFTSYTHTSQDNSLLGNVVNHFCEDDQHRIWIATDDGGLTCFNPADNTFTPVQLAPKGTATNVHALHREGSLLYVGTYTQGLYIKDLQTNKVQHVPDFLDEQGRHFDASSYAISSDHAHRIWVGTFGHVAVFHPDTRTFSQVKRVGGLVTDIYEDHAHRLWVATEGSGLWVLDERGVWKHHQQLALETHGEGTPATVYSLYEDRQGILWVGTANGLYCYDAANDRFLPISLLSGVVSVYGITVVEKDLWLATSAGILCYSPAKRVVQQVYKKSHNIASIDFMPAAICRSHDGYIYLGTTNGFVTFKPQSMHRNQVQPHIVFTGLDVFGRPATVGSTYLPVRLPYMDELRLTYRENVIRIHFSAMSFLQSSDILYSYYLEGFDDDWIEAGNHQSITYTNLTPGTYVLHVRATTNDGMQSADTTLPIVITPPFYWNTPAKVIYLLLLVAAIILIVRHLLRKKERKHVAEIKELNEQKEQEVHDARIKFMTINDKDQEFLDRMEAIIEQNFSNSELSVDYLASELGVSRSSLFAKIKALADVTPNEMIQVIRLKHAASLLQTGNYRVNEVCYMVGFSSPSYFAKCFQRQYACTPAKYKG